MPLSVLGGVELQWRGFELGAEMILYFIKTLSVNSFIAWRMVESEQDLITEGTFGGLDKYRERLARILPFSDYVCELAEEFLTYGSELDSQGTPSRAGTSTVQNSQEDITIPKSNRIILQHSKRR